MIRKEDVKLIYGLSPLQEGMFFHHLLDPASKSHFNQLAFRIQGHLDVNLFLDSFQEIVDRHDILRTAFVQGSSSGPLQVVLKAQLADFSYNDLRSEGAKEDIVARYKQADRERLFVLDSGRLIRVCLMQLNDDLFELVLTYHHILMDGWCMSVVTDEFFNVYGGKVRNIAVELPRIVPYRDYIEWLRKIDKESSLAFWKRYLLDYDVSSPAPGKILNHDNIFNREATELVLDRKLTAALEAVGAAHGLTTNSIIESIWGLLLCKYNGTSEAVFGIVVSGRPAELDNVERMVGLFANTIPLRISLGENDSFEDMMRSTQDRVIASDPHQYMQLAKVFGQSPLGHNLLDHIMVFENFRLEERVGSDIRSEQLGISVISEEAFGHNSYEFSVLVFSGDEITVRFEYNSNRYDSRVIADVSRHFRTIAENVVRDLTLPANRVLTLSPEEVSLLTKKFNSTIRPYDLTKTVIDLFETQVELFPDRPAIVYAGQEISYRTLNQRANRLAHHLKQTGIRNGQLVAICMRRSDNLACAILGTLKANAAYVPIDPNYPASRIQYIVEKSGTNVMLVDESLAGFPNVQQISFKNYIDHGSQQPNPSRVAAGSDLAYVIFTSGSTGNPKGCMISQSNLSNYIQWCHEYYFENQKQGNSCLITSVSFDLTVTALYTPLTRGRTLYIGDEGKDFGQLLKESLENPAIDTIKLTPSQVSLMRDLDLRSVHIRNLICGGEQLDYNSLHHLWKLKKDIRVFNEYGPTETTVGCIACRVSDKEHRMMIGKPIANTKIFIVDAASRPVPVSVVGEIIVSGEGVGLGYLGSDGISGYVADQFDTESKSLAYKTGDLGRWHHDGNIELIGRADDQVKIRGYRVEPGEIEAILTKSGMTKQASVIVGEQNGVKHLHVFVILLEGFDKQAIQKFLEQSLPHYMVPSRLTIVSHFPLNENGKIDRRTMLALSDNTDIRRPYEGPRNEVESKLCSIWQELLEVAKVGISDNFFELGGDSIVSIQAANRARRNGIELFERDIFKYQSVGALAEYLGKRSSVGKVSNAEQGQLKGESGLLPIQREFLEHADSSLNHFNQSFLLGIDRKIDPSKLESVIKILFAHHDALRFVYTHEDDGWHQHYGLAEGRLEVVDVSTLENEELNEVVTSKANGYQRSLNIEKGDVFRAVLFHTPPRDPWNRLLIIVHHLAIDGVSWRILLDDIGLLLSGSAPGTKSSSYRQWHEALKNYSSTYPLLAQASYWRDVVSAYEPFKVDHPTEQPVLKKDLRSFSTRLDESLTRKLLRDVSAAYHTEINDILMCALAKTLTEYTGRDRITIGLEGHGRESYLAETIDLSRTVGWFTTIYPVSLKIEKERSAAWWIMSVKEQLRAVPGKGIGYGVLKYICRDESLRNKAWDIVFNYLGQADNVLNNNKWFTGVHESPGESIGSAKEIREKISIDGIIYKGSLELTWTYSATHFDAATIDKLAQECIKTLFELVVHCLNQAKPVFTPSDYQLGEYIGNEELQAFLDEVYEGQQRREAMETMYGLSSLQEGMLFHGLYEPGSGAYINQMVCDLYDVDIDVYKAAWERILKEHSSLRTGFYHEGLGKAVQCVYKEAKVPITIIDWRGKEEDLEEFEQEDRVTPFDFGKPPLMRISLLRIDNHRYRMLLTFHHIIMDGWSLAVLIEDFLLTYDELTSGILRSSTNEDRYEDYIRYIAGRGLHSQEAYWKKYLSRLEGKTLLPFVGSGVDRSKGIGQYKQHESIIDAVSTRAIETWAQQHHVTVNTIMQAAWSYMLHRYTGSNHVCYGVTVSGRPDDLSAIERRVGMYINTLPLYSELRENDKIVDWLTSIQADQLRSREYQHTSLIDIQKWLDIKGEFFDTIMVFENYPVSQTISQPRWQLKATNMIVNDHTNYPLTIIIHAADVISIRLDYNSDIIDHGTVAMISGHFNKTLSEIVRNGVTAIRDIKMITEEERALILNDFNATTVQLPDRTIVDLFEEQARKHPEYVAVEFRSLMINYGEINARANRLANYLLSQGLAPGSIIPLCIERGVEMIVALLAIYKTGCGYAPLDPRYPAERVQYMIDDIDAEFILTHNECMDLVGKHSPSKIINIDEESGRISKASGRNPSIVHKGKRPGYLLYTSGSTGKPKGVSLPERALINLLLWHQQHVNVSRGHKVLQFASINFDASFQEIFSALCFGGTVVLIDEMKRKDMAEMSAVIDRHSVNYLFIPYIVLKHLSEFARAESSYPSSLKAMFVGGEQLRLDNDIEEYFVRTGARILNYYGPSETHGVTSFEVMLDDFKSGKLPPIGKPVPNSTIYITNPDDSLCELGVAGEILIGGDQVADGYHRRDDLTTRRFIANPFSDKPGARVYRTGDIGRWRPDGNIEFLGRRDDQVKIRGNRVEPGEVASVLSTAPGVGQCVVVARSSKEGNMLVAYFTSTNAAADSKSVRAFLVSKLPDYMIPALFVQIDTLPVTNNGKIDKRALPEPALAVEERVVVPPADDLERSIVETWSEILKVSSISVTDNFFTLGGHSLMATRVISLLQRRTGYRISVRDIFERATVEQLASYLRDQSQSPAAPAFSSIQRPANIPLSYSQEAYWRRDQKNASQRYYLPLFRFEGLLDKEAVEYAFREIVRRHEILRTVIREKNGILRQEVLPFESWSIQYMPVVNDVDRAVNGFLANRIDLSKDYVFRILLVRQSDQMHIVVPLLHHIAFDGWSISILESEFVELYMSKKECRASRLKRVPLQYADYAIWQRSTLVGDKLSKHIDYWKRTLENVRELPLHFDHPKNSRSRGFVKQYKHLLTESQTSDIIELSQRHAVSPFMMLLSVFMIFLQQRSGQRDICVGTHIAGRQHEEVESTIGVFANTLCIRTSIERDVTFLDIMHAVKETSLRAYEHQEAPFDLVAGAINPGWSEHHHELFNVVFGFLNLPVQENIKLEGVTLTYERNERVPQQADLELHVIDRGKNYQLTLIFRDDLFDEDTVIDMTTQIVSLLDAVVSFEKLIPHKIIQYD